MTDYSVLVERLREWWTAWGAPMDRDECVNEGCMAMDCNEAAAAIEALAEEVDRLHSVAQAETDMRVGTFDTITQLQNQLDAETKLHLENESRHMALAMGWKNRIERLEGALQSLYDNEKYDDDDPRLGCARDLARAALKEKP